MLISLLDKEKKFKFFNEKKFILEPEGNSFTYKTEE